MRPENEELKKILRLLKIGITLTGIAIACSVWAIINNMLCNDSLKALREMHFDNKTSLFSQDVERVRHTQESFAVLLESDTLTPRDIGIRKFAFMANAHAGMVNVIHRLVLGHDEARLAHHVSVWKSDHPIEFPIVARIDGDTSHVTKLRIEDKHGFRSLEFKDDSLIVSNENNILSISGDPLNESAATVKYWLEQKTVESMSELYPDITKLEGTDGWIYSARVVD